MTDKAWKIARTLEGASVPAMEFVIRKALTEARNEALEDAAKVVTEMDETEFAQSIATAIRAKIEGEG